MSALSLFDLLRTSHDAWGVYTKLALMHRLNPETVSAEKVAEALAFARQVKRDLLQRLDVSES